MYIEYEDKYSPQLEKLQQKINETKMGEIQTLQFRQFGTMENEKDEQIAGALDFFVENCENFAENYLYRSNHVTLKDIVCSFFVDNAGKGVDGSNPYVYEVGYYTMWDSNSECEEKTIQLTVEDVLEFALKQKYVVFNTDY